MKNNKGFTIVELVIVIAVIAILAAVLIPTFTNVIQKANGAADTSLLTNINKILAVEESDGSIKTTKDVYQVLSVNGIAKSSIVAKQNNYEFVYNKGTNRFEYLEKGWKNTIYNTAKDIYSAVADWRNSFGATVNGNKVTGFEEFTGSTTFTYKYLTSENKVIVGDTVTEDNTLRYFLHVPANYDPKISYPIITYIHGSGGCVYYQSSGMGFEQITDNSYFNDKSFALNWLRGNNTTVYTHLYTDGSMKQAGGDGAFGSWDTPFVKTWFEWVQTHPEDDAFFIFVQLNDETWFENQAGSYSYAQEDTSYTDLTGLCIANACLAGTQNNTYYGSYVSGVTSGWRNAIAYKSYYNSSVLGENVWFQLLTQAIDSLAEEYNVNLDRQYVLGASLGGISTYDLLYHNPDRFAAVFPCAAPCTDISVENIERIVAGGTVIRAYHGSGDGLVDLTPSKTFCEAVVAAGGDAVFTSDAGGHKSEYLKDHFTEIMDVIRNTSK